MAESKRSGAKRPAARGAARKSSPAKKAAVKKAAAKAPAKKAAVKKAPAKKAPAKQAAVKKAPAKKAAAKKAPAKKAAAKKAPAKKAAVKKAPAKQTAAGRATEKAAAPVAPPARPVRQLPPPSKGPGMSDRRWPSGPEVRIPVERQKAAQAAGTFELADLPSWLAEPSSAIRVGKGEASDVHLIPSGVRSLDSIARLRPGQVIVNYGKSEAKWATDYSRRRGGRAGFLQLLSYARQMIGADSSGNVRICLMGHAGQGFSEALWIERDGIVLTVQPNDIILRIDGLDLGE